LERGAEHALGLVEATERAEHRAELPSEHGERDASDFYVARFDPSPPDGDSTAKLGRGGVEPPRADVGICLLLDALSDADVGEARPRARRYGISESRRARRRVPRRRRRVRA